MNDIERIRALLDSTGKEMTAKQISVKLGISVHRASGLLLNQVKQERLGRLVRNGDLYYYSIRDRPALVRHIMADETERRHERYVATKKVGDRSYTCTHMDMLTILASQGNERAKEEIMRRNGVKA